MNLRRNLSDLRTVEVRDELFLPQCRRRQPDIPQWARTCWQSRLHAVNDHRPEAREAVLLAIKGPRDPFDNDQRVTRAHGAVSMWLTHVVASSIGMNRSMAWLPGSMV